MSQAANQVQEVVQQALGRFEQLAASEAPPSHVLNEMLQALVQSTASLGGVVWMPTDPQAMQHRVIARTGRLAALAIEGQADPLPASGPVIAQCAEHRKSIIVAPDSPYFQSTELQPTAQFFVPMDAMSRCYGVIQLIASGQIDPKSYRQFAAFAQQAARSAGTYLARRQSQIVNEGAASQAALLRLTHQILKIDRPIDLIHELATLARPLLDAQRLAVVGFWRKRGDVAFSDTVDVDRKAVVVRAVEMLAEIMRTRQAPMLFTRGQELDGEDQALEPLLEDVFSQSGAQAICLTPMRDDDRIVGVMVAEYAQADAASRQAELQQQISRQTGPVLARTTATYHRPLRRTSAAIEALREHPGANTVRALAILAVLGAVVYALCFMPVDIIVRGDARLEPSRLAQVTAPIDGRVRHVRVSTGDFVRAGDVLAELDDTDLLQELSEVERAISAKRVERDAAAARMSSTDPRAASRAHAEHGQAELEIQSQSIRRDRILKRIEDARIRAAIDGVVLTEKPQQLEGMTVNKGDVLLRVADLREFELVAELHEADLALVEQVLREGATVPVTFLSHAWPDKPQHATITELRSLAPTSVPDEYQRQHVFRVTVPVELHDISEQLVLANPSGRTRLTTGSGSVAYRYGRGVWRFIQMTVLF